MQKSVDLFDEEFKKREVIERIIKKAIEILMYTKLKNTGIEYEFRFRGVTLTINSYVNFYIDINLYELYFIKNYKDLEERENEFAEIYSNFIMDFILKKWESFILK